MKDEARQTVIKLLVETMKHCELIDDVRGRLIMINLRAIVQLVQEKGENKWSSKNLWNA